MAFFLWLVLAAGVGALAAALWQRPGVRRLLDQQPTEPAPWKGLEIWVIVLAFFFLPVLVHSLLLHTHFFVWLLGSEHVPTPATEPTEAAQHLLVQRRQPWIMLVSSPLLILLVWSATWPHSDRPLARMGFDTDRFGKNLVLGLLAGLVCTAVANALHAGASWLSIAAFGTVPEEHALSELARRALAPAEWTALVASAVVAAPLTEELLFRGVLQRWWAARPEGGDVAMSAAFVMALVLRTGKIMAFADGATSSGLWAEMAPALFVLALVPVYGLVRWRAASPGPPAVFGTAVLFAAAHSSVWPTPVPLVALGLGLGLLAQRTQSLVAPVVVHAVFNAAACGVLLFGR